MLLTESAVSDQIADFNRLMKWRVYRNNVSLVRFEAGASPVAFGEPGMPDLRMEYPYISADPRYFGSQLSYWVEVKKPGLVPLCPPRCKRQYYAPKAPRTGLVQRNKVCTLCRQKEWREKEERNGGVVLVVGNIPDAITQVDDFEEYRDWYHAHYSWLHGPEAPRRGTQTMLPLDWLKSG